MTVHELSRGDARRIAVRAQLLDSSRPPRRSCPLHASLLALLTPPP